MPPSPDTSGIVTHLQRFSVHDGPGIRTTVFLKGCQMRCPWCHNPETYRAAPELQVFAARCIGCGACVDRCPQQARGVEAGLPVYHRERCGACGRCADACYAQALVLVGRRLTARQVLDEVLADRGFYASSGGGVTLSGGEPLAQPEFVAAILHLCRGEGLHVAVETNLAWPWSAVEPLVPAIDLFLVDLKLLDDRQHRAWTGVSNRHTLENLRRLDAAGKPLLVRTPVIGGVNDRPEQIAAIADWLGGLQHLQQYQLLPYHPLGTGKHEALGLAPPDARLRVPSADQLDRLAAAARRRGLEVSIAGRPPSAQPPAAAGAAVRGE